VNSSSADAADPKSAALGTPSSVNRAFPSTASVLSPAEARELGRDPLERVTPRVDLLEGRAFAERGRDLGDAVLRETEPTERLASTEIRRERVERVGVQREYLQRAHPRDAGGDRSGEFVAVEFECLHVHEGEDRVPRDAIDAEAVAREPQPREVRQRRDGTRQRRDAVTVRVEDAESVAEREDVVGERVDAGVAEARDAGLRPRRAAERERGGGRGGGGGGARPRRRRRRLRRVVRLEGRASPPWPRARP
jgi:hypothetical protein